MYKICFEHLSADLLSFRRQNDPSYNKTGSFFQFITLRVNNYLFNNDHSRCCENSTNVNNFYEYFKTFEIDY